MAINITLLYLGCDDALGFQSLMSILTVTDWLIKAVQYSEIRIAIQKKESVNALLFFV